jgi:hypothetical protein
MAKFRDETPRIYVDGHEVTAYVDGISVEYDGASKRPPTAEITLRLPLVSTESDPLFGGLVRVDVGDGSHEE